MRKFLLACLPLLACAPGPEVYGELGGVSSSARLSADGAVESLSLRFSPALFTGTTDLAAYVELPEEARGGTIVDHLRLESGFTPAQ